MVGRIGCGFAVLVCQVARLACRTPPWPHLLPAAEEAPKPAAKKVKVKAEATPAAGVTAGRAKRERKQVEVYTAAAPKEVAFVIKPGTGSKLRDIPNVAFKLSKITGRDELVEHLHLVRWHGVLDGWMAVPCIPSLLGSSCSPMHPLGTATPASPGSAAAVSTEGHAGQPEEGCAGVLGLCL